MDWVNHLVVLAPNLCILVVSYQAISIRRLTLKNFIMIVPIRVCDNVVTIQSIVSFTGIIFVSVPGIIAWWWSATIPREFFPNP